MNTSKSKPIIVGLLGTAVAMLGACVLVVTGGTGCRQLDPTGVYKGDQILYNADLTIDTSYKVVHTFVKWEKDNRVVLSSKPQIKQAADKMRRDYPNWVKSALACRDAYAANPEPVERTNLQKAIDVLRQAIREANRYILEGVDARPLAETPH